MTATQSHAARLNAMPATRLAWPGDIDHARVQRRTVHLRGVHVGRVGDLRRRHRVQRAATVARSASTLRAFEQVEWRRADLDHWIAVQAFEGALRTIESGDGTAGLHAGLRAKTAVAEAAERALGRIPQVLGGGTFSRRSPVASWFEDVRALGFLRPPWGSRTTGSSRRRSTHDGSNAMTICISADSHVTEPPDTYLDRIDPALPRPRAARCTTTTRSAT